MDDILLKFDFTDRAGRKVYNVFHQIECHACDKSHWAPTGQQLRFDMDGNLKLSACWEVMGDD